MLNQIDLTKFKCCEITISEDPGEGKGRSKIFFRTKEYRSRFGLSGVFLNLTITEKKITQTFMEFIRLVSCIYYGDKP